MDKDHAVAKAIIPPYVCPSCHTPQPDVDNMRRNLQSQIDTLQAQLKALKNSS